MRYLIILDVGSIWGKDYGEYGAMSKAISRLGTRITSAITTGRKPIQHIVISCIFVYRIKAIEQRILSCNLSIGTVRRISEI